MCCPAAHYRASQQITSARPSTPPPSPKYAFIMAQLLHDRASPWNLNLVLLAHLFNHGIHVLLHDNLWFFFSHFYSSQRSELLFMALTLNLPLNLAATVTIMNGSSPPSSFSAPLPFYLDLSTLYTTDHELESWEGAISSQVFFRSFLSLWGAPPLPTFAATPEALGITLMHGVHRWPETVESYFHLDRAPHDTPLTY